MDGGPILAATAIVYVTSFASSYLSLAELRLTEFLGIGPVALQIGTLALAWRAWIAYSSAHHNSSREAIHSIDGTPRKRLPHIPPSS